MLNAVARFVDNLSFNDNLNIEKYLHGKGSNDQRFRIRKKSRLYGSNNSKQNKSVLKKLWSKSSGVLTRNDSNDELPLLNRHISMDKLSTKSSIIEVDSLVKRNEKNEVSFQETKINRKAGFKHLKEIFNEVGGNDLSLESNNRSEGSISPFNYKCYPLTNSQMLNWMNRAWSEYEIEENDANKCMVMELGRKSRFELNKKIITPFHSLATPKISIGDYYISRIVKFVSLTPVDFCVMVILIRRAVGKSGGILRITTLTAHRLVLAAALLTHKLMYDVQYGIKFWAHIGGVPQWEMVMLEYHLLKILEWDLCINYGEFKKTYFEILSNKDQDEREHNKRVNSNQFNCTDNKNKQTKLQINISKLNSNRKKC
ncbi:cyclin family protein [Cryptosporidium felis]|nr:cyclin family protein [Cryptosporidium felis]